MNETVLEALNLAGVDVKGAVARFAGNDALYLKFLKSCLLTIILQRSNQPWMQGIWRQP